MLIIIIIIIIVVVFVINMESVDVVCERKKTKLSEIVCSEREVRVCTSTAESGATRETESSTSAACSADFQFSH